jgi:KDO2-lipid IV(A) lauroyltransferase
MVVPKIPLPVGYAGCRWLAGLLYRFNASGRATIERNLRHILGPQATAAAVAQQARSTFDTIVYNYFDLFQLPHLADETVRRAVTLHGWEHVEAALAPGQGAIMISTHLGNIEMILYRMLLQGVSITIPVERVEPPQLFDYISALRMSKGLKLVPIDGPLLALRRTLKKGGIVGLAGDRDITQTGQVVLFFGHPAHLPDGHVRLAAKTGVPLLVGFSRRNHDHTHSAYFLPPFYLPTGSESEQLQAGMNFIVEEMEKAIRQNPAQWTVTVSIWADD